MTTNQNNAFPILFLLVCTFYLDGCGILFGNVRPLEERSEHYVVNDLSGMDSDWEKIETKKPRDENPQSSDLAYQSRSKASIIAINTACRDTYRQKDLRSLAQTSFLGITEITSREEKNLMVNGQPALQTTLSGTLNQESMSLRTIVLKQEACFYNLMYVARPQIFPDQEMAFTRFVESFRIKDEK